MLNGTSTSVAGGKLEATLNYTRGRFGNVPAPGEPVKIVWEVPTETRDVTVPFELQDLPLP